MTIFTNHTLVECSGKWISLADQDSLSGEISFSSSISVARSWASPMAAGMMSLLWRCGWMVSWSAWPILISRLAVFHLQGDMTYIVFNAFHSCRASISMTLSSWGENMSEWETAWENQRIKTTNEKHSLKTAVWYEELFILTCFELEIFWFNLMSSRTSPSWFSST